MKKTIAILFILLIGLTVLAGCGTQTLEPVEKEDVVKEDMQEEEQDNGIDYTQPPALPEE